MPTHTFDKVALYGEKSVKCDGGCGRRLRRKREFFQTLSPFNKNADGSLKQPEQIRAELTEQLNAWKQESETCIHCA